MISNFHANTGSKVPADYNMIMLWHEHGGTWEDFMATPHDIMGKFLEMKSAEAEGKDRASKTKK